jgi:hypothetical protein
VYSVAEHQVWCCQMLPALATLYLQRYSGPGGSRCRSSPRRRSRAAAARKPGHGTAKNTVQPLGTTYAPTVLTVSVRYTSVVLVRCYLPDTEQVAGRAGGCAYDHHVLRALSPAAHGRTRRPHRAGRQAALSLVSQRRACSTHGTSWLCTACTVQRAVRDSVIAIAIVPIWRHGTARCTHPSSLQNSTLLALRTSCGPTKPPCE